MRPEDIDALRDAGAGLDTDLRVVQDGRVLCCVGLLATFYFADGGIPEQRERLAAALDQYRRAVGDRLVWAADPFTGAPTKISGTDIANPRVWMPKVGPREPVDLLMHGGREPDDADPYRVIAKACSLRPSELSYFSFSLPFAWIADRPAGAFTRLVLEVCDILAPTHGYAGLAVLPHVDVGSGDPAMAAVVALVARFAGLEIDLAWSHNIYLAQEDRIKGVNWLTILDQSWIDRLGGNEALRAALGEGIEWHSFGTGTVIQAGPRPLVGDTHHQEPMPHYRQVALALKPIRIDSVRAIAHQYGFGRERSDQWLRRFDG
jgi:hypothetical protein